MTLSDLEKCLTLPGESVEHGSGGGGGWGGAGGAGGGGTLLALVL